MMRKIILIAFSSLVLFNGCTNGQGTGNKTDLTASEFNSGIAEYADAIVVDVRTPDEFSAGHIENAVNIDWNSDGFNDRITKLERTAPVFVYCLSGGRSSSAASHMRDAGFTKVYELDGGIMKWRAADLPVVSGSNAPSNGMSLTDFEKIIASEKLVLVDYYADWCAPCKKMKPYLEQIEHDMSSTVKVVRINVDKNEQLAKQMKIEVLPTLHLYKNNKVIWSNEGYIGKEEVLEQLK